MGSADEAMIEGEIEEMMTQAQEIPEEGSLAGGGFASPQGFRARFLKASEIGDEWGINLLLCGYPGSGKTTLAAQAQDSEWGKEVFFIDFEGGTRSISDRADVTVFKPNNWNDLREAFLFISQGDHEFKTVVVDSLTEAQQINIKDIQANQKDPDIISQYTWMKTNDNIKTLIRQFRTLSQTNGLNVIFTTLLREDKDDELGIVTLNPALTPGAAMNASGIIDTVGFLVKDRESERRKLILEHQGRFKGKVRQPIHADHNLPTQIYDPHLGQILDFLHGGDIKLSTE